MDSLQPGAQLVFANKDDSLNPHGMIRAYVFINGKLGNQTNTNAQDAWYALRDHPKLEHIFVVDAATPENRDFIQHLQVRKFPTIVWMEQTSEASGKSITRIEGAAGYQQIYDLYLKLLKGQYGGLSQGEGSTPAIIPGDAEDFSLGFGAGLGGNVGKWLLWWLAAYVAYQATKD